MQAPGQSWLFEILRVFAHWPHLDLATDSIPAGAPCSPIDVLLAPFFIFFNCRRFRQVGRLRNWALEQSYSHGLDGLVKASPVWVLVPRKTTTFASFERSCGNSRVRWLQSLGRVC